MVFVDSGRRGFPDSLLESAAVAPGLGASVAADPSSAHLWAVMTHPPKARHVVDSFHIVKRMNEKRSALRRDLHRKRVEPLDLEALK